jgi:Tol biopolymer transport system component
MSLAPGVRLGPYEILSAIGAGGMGEVYKARDTRLERTVAIKILPTSDPVRRQRFEREARAVAALNHPNICTLHDVGQQDGTDFLVMEYLEGQTLAERLSKGALPLNQVLQFAVQIAEALHAAHRRGIVHRDLKPGNIMLTKAGAKLLDFGIATIRAITPADGAATRTERTLTAEGVLIGTLHYMAPEQLEGREADARSDLFAFGAVVYEMVTGHRAFAGESESKIIAAVLDSEPSPITASQPLTPPVLGHVVMRCLAKDPDQRWQSARDLAGELRWITELTFRPDVTARAPQEPVRRTVRRYVWLLAATVLLTMVAVAGRLEFARSSVDGNVYRTTIMPPGPLMGPGPGRLSISPDGRRLALIAPDPDGRVVVWVRALNGLTAQPLAGTDGASWLFWSPDSRFLGFIAAGKLKRIEASGGPVHALANAVAFGGTWNRDNVILFRPADQFLIHRVSADGGMPVPVTALDEQAGDVEHGLPFFLPDSNHFLYSAATRDGRHPIFVGSLDSTQRTKLLEEGSTAKYAQGFLLFVRDTTLMVQPFDAERLRLTGEPTPQGEGLVIGSGVFGGGSFSVAESGPLVFQTGPPTATSGTLAWFDRNGAKSEILEQEAGGDLELSPDGTRASVTEFERNNDIWIVDLARDQRTRFTSEPVNESSPIWSPDGRVAFSRALIGGQAFGGDLYLKAANGIGAEALLLQDALEKTPMSWSADGRFLLYARTTGVSRTRDLWVLPLFGDRNPFPIFQTRFNESRGKFSPDGQWVAFTSDESGRTEVYAAPFPGPGEKTLVSTAGGDWPRWRRDGKEIFYVSPTNRLMSATLDGQGTRMTIKTVKELFELQPRGTRYFYDVSPDGQRFLVITGQKAPTSVQPLTIVVNWVAGLTK